jgi:hypothetical protein
MKNKEKRGPLRFRDVMEIVSGQSEGNAKIKGRTDKEGNKIPDGMPMWRYRMGQRRR